MNQRIWMPYLRQEGVQNIAGFYFQAGCINAGMAADKCMAGNNIFINKQFYPVFGVVHQSQDTDGTGGDIQKPFQEVFWALHKKRFLQISVPRTSSIPRHPSMVNAAS